MQLGRASRSCFRVQGSGFRVQGLGFKVQGSGFVVSVYWFQFVWCDVWCLVVPRVEGLAPSTRQDLIVTPEEKTSVFERCVDPEGLL